MQTSAAVQQGTESNFLRKWLNRNFSFAFFAGFGLTLLIHAFAFLNHLNNHDQIRNTFAMPASFVLGRWFLDVALEVGTRLSMPWFNGVLMALLLGLSVAFIVDMYQMQNKTLIFLLAFCFVSFSSISSTVMFIHIADIMGMSILLSTIAAWMTVRWKWGFLPALLPLTLSMGIYQAFWSFAVALLAIHGLLLLLQGKMTDKEIFGQALRYVLLLLGSAACYMVANKILLSITETALHAYMGVDQMYNFPLLRIPYLMKNGYLAFFHYIFNDARLDGHSFGMCIQIFLLLFSAISILLFTLQKQRTLFQALCIAGISLLLPLALNSVHLLNPASVYELMTLSISGLYILASLLAEKWLLCSEKKRLTTRGAVLATAFCLSITGFYGAARANQQYYMASLDFNASSSYMTRVVARLESHEAFTRETPVAFVGAVSAGNYGNVPFYGLMDRYRGQKPLDHLKSDSHIRGFLFGYLEITFPLPSPEQDAALREMEQVQAMPSYPAKDCIQLIDGVLVVKVGPPR